MYYRLHWSYDQEDELGLDFAVLGDNPDLGVTWLSGMPFQENISQPIACELDPDESGPDMPDYFGHGFPLFSERLVDSIRQAGCDNYQMFDVELLNPVTQHVYTEYKAINIIGLVACADTSLSIPVPGYQMGIMK